LNQWKVGKLSEEQALADDPILVVDDETMYHDIVRAVLSESRRNVDYVLNGSEAIKATQSHQYSMILMDIEMPVIDGIQATAKIRALGGWGKSCPIIAFTSLRPDTGIQYFRHAGFDDFLSKPFAIGELTSMVIKWTGSDPRLAAQLDPHTRLANLIGVDQANAMIARFHEQLEAGLAAIDGGEDIRHVAHRIGGLAGMIGLSALSKAWLRLQNGDRSGLQAVRVMTHESLNRHRASIARDGS
jgi:CheY-like chemotaxis protein